MKILLTGGCGFIGSNILRSLINDSRVSKIVVLDNLSTGKFENISFSNKTSKVEFINGDIRDLNTCQLAIKDVNVVLHQAALGSVPRSIENPINTNDNNINGFLNMIYVSNAENVDKFIFAASSSTYGDSKLLPKKEEIIGKPLSPYALTKYVNEIYADVFNRCYGLNYIGLRYFNVFGPNQDPNSSYSAVIPKFCSNIIKGQDIIINGDGSISRDFTYIDNVVQANLLSIFSTIPESNNQIYNVACGEMYSIQYLAKELVKISGAKVNIINGPARQGDIDYSKASIEKIIKYLGYKPLVKFNEGLRRTWEHYRLRRLNYDL